ncbi:MAG: signal recognition particle-docking protein FtsY, partial [Pseudomonadota bacterium]
KERLFKSQKKLDEGLDALVKEGGEVEPVAEPPQTAPRSPEPEAEVKHAEPEPEPTPVAEPDPAPVPVAEPELVAVADPAEEVTRPSFLARAFGAKPKKTRILDDEMLESLEEVLIQADMGVETALALSARLSESHYGKRVGTDDLKRLLADEIAEILRPVARPLPIYAKRPQVVLVVGVNGSGKTTTIGKLASQLSSAGKRVVIAAGDTFRAAAVEQLQVWGQRAGVPVLTADQGSDPASLAYEALVKAEADGADLLLIDTAGRLQNRQDLMEELAKIVRVLRKKDPSAPHNTLLVLDATTGQNALSQVDIFAKIADVSGLVMTKLDGTAKGGVLVALADRFGLPIHAIGVGESIDDLAPFDPEDFAAAVTGAES